MWNIYGHWLMNFANEKTNCLEYGHAKTISDNSNVNLTYFSHWQL